MITIIEDGERILFEKDGETTFITLKRFLDDDSLELRLASLVANNGSWMTLWGNYDDPTELLKEILQKNLHFIHYECFFIPDSRNPKCGKFKGLVKETGDNFSYMFYDMKKYWEVLYYIKLYENKVSK